MNSIWNTKQKEQYHVHNRLTKLYNCTQDFKCVTWARVRLPLEGSRSKTVTGVNNSTSLSGPRKRGASFAEKPKAALLCGPIFNKTPVSARFYQNPGPQPYAAPPSDLLCTWSDPPYSHEWTPQSWPGITGRSFSSHANTEKKQC